MNVSKQQVDAVFYAALQIGDLRQRTFFLEQSCGDDAELRAAVDALIAAHASAEDFFARGFSDLALSAGELRDMASDDWLETERLQADDIDTQIGRYRLVRKLGEGGGGVVYLARQSEPVKREVALKIIKLGMDTRDVIARFDVERQALAMMDHPNIARVFDAGATSSGRPYFVMELVRGTRITEFCDANKLGVAHRLDLFVQVCGAIQHAHQKGVIHRDIKPSNVLVAVQDEKPVPRVIDFGIAKATAGRWGDTASFGTRELMIGTPAYMSPEQAAGGGVDVDTRSDIYSLGALLYELLTGKPPFDAKALAADGLDAMRRTLREVEPPRPSALLTTLPAAELDAVARNLRTGPAQLVSQLKGDLDWIILRALEKDRTRRYGTVNGLAADIQRFLRNEPVVARPPDRLYRFRKLVRRNQTVFAAGLVVFVTLLAGITVSSRLFVRERAALRQQEKLRVIAEQAERDQALMRQQAEDREKIAQAAMLVGKKKLAEADALLSEITTPPPRPSLDGVEAFRWSGEYAALNGQWAKAAARFSVLLKMNKLEGWDKKWDWVTSDYLSCGVALAESGDTAGFEDFRAATIAELGSTKNRGTVERLLRATLLLPADGKTLDKIAPAALHAMDLVRERPAQGETVEWMPTALALWQYRQGDYAGSVAWGEHALSVKPPNVMPTTIARTVLAMANHKLGRAEEARAHLNASRVLIENRFKRPLDRGSLETGYWFDCAYAHVLVREAIGLIETSGD